MAAGLGFKTFTTGEVLTAADTNGYLMQGVLVFASSAARAAAITSPQEGQYSYLKDTNSTEYYDGAAWIAAPIGDITGVTAGTGISGGGTSGTVTVTNSMATEITAAGDIIVGTGSGTFDNLPIGTTAQVLTADTTVSPYKVKWASPASAGGMTLLSTTTMSGSSTTVSSISQDYVNLYVVLENVTVSVDAEVSFRIVSSTNAHYQYYLSAQSATVGTVNGGSGTLTGGATMDDVGTGGMGNWSMTFNNYSQGKRFGFSGQGLFYKPSWCAYWFGGGFESTTAMSSLAIVASNSATLGGTIKIYGVK